MTTTPEEILGYVAEYLEALNEADAKYQAEYIERSIQKYVEEGKTLEAATERVRSYASERSYTYSSEIGRRYIRIVQNDMMGHALTGQRFAHAFVEVETGLVYKSATWNAPAKGARFDLTNETDRALLFANCEFSGGYLYADRVAEIRRNAEEVNA
jgi:hypothetical protein